jgi:hypothetical protein
MQLHYGAIPGERRDLRDPSWRRVCVPDRDLSQLFAFQLSLALGMAVLLLWASATTPDILAIEYATLAGACIVLAPLHELAHVAVFPQSTRAAAVVTFRPSRLVLCARYSGELSRNRYLWMMGMPLLAISCVPSLVVASLGYAPRHAALLPLLNALVSGQDLLAMILVLAQVPADGVLRLLPDATVWKPRPSN